MRVLSYRSYLRKVHEAVGTLTSDDRVEPPNPVEIYDPEFFGEWLDRARKASGPTRGDRVVSRERIYTRSDRADRGLAQFFKYLARQINADLGYA